MAGKNPILIAEIGCSHAGSLERAFYLSDLACSNGADVIKFQKTKSSSQPLFFLWFYLLRA
jgi:sialic acid synthase SpsE